MAPESSTGVPDPVIQTGSDIQIDRVNIGTANGPAGSGDTPPSSDSGVHSLGEQWENIQIRWIWNRNRTRNHPTEVTHAGLSVGPVDLRILRKVIDSIAPGRIVYQKGNRMIFCQWLYGEMTGKLSLIS